MLIAEYSYEKDIQIKQQEARQEGWDQAILLSGKILEELKRTPFHTSGQIAEKLGCSPELVEEIRKKID